MKNSMIALLFSLCILFQSAHATDKTIKDQPYFPNMTLNEFVIGSAVVAFIAGGTLAVLYCKASKLFFIVPTA